MFSCCRPAILCPRIDLRELLGRFTPCFLVKVKSIALEEWSHLLTIHPLQRQGVVYFSVPGPDGGIDVSA